jgi:Zn-dependent protease with chaperone function
MYIRFIAQVSLAIARARQGMAQSGGWVTWINPFYWFFALYAKCYQLLSAGFSRSREFLADRMACCLYGSDVFQTALAKVVTDGTLFEITVYENVIDNLQKGKAFVNMYAAFRTFREEQLTMEERAKFNRKLLNEKPSLFAAHPTYAERVAAAEALPKAAGRDNAPAIALLDKPQEIEKVLTDFLTDYINHLCRR